MKKGKVQLNSIQGINSTKVESRDTKIESRLQPKLISLNLGTLLPEGRPVSKPNNAFRKTFIKSQNNFLKKKQYPGTNDQSYTNSPREFSYYQNEIPKYSPREINFYKNQDGFTEQEVFDINESLSTFDEMFKNINNDF